MTMYLFLLPAVILAGFLFPVETMPAFFRWLALADPVMHFLVVVRGVFLKGHGMVELWPEYLVLAGTAAAVLALAVDRFRRGLA